MPKLSLTVNGEAVEADVEGRTLLSQLLREHLSLTGTHIGCDTSQCGACLVHVEGRVVKSCAMLALEADGAQVTTIEGIGANGLTPVQQAFQAHHGLQCGFCTPGMIMSAAALLAENPKPSVAEISAHLDGNLCRCTGYNNIIKSILAASGQSVNDMQTEV
jgi:carbon-monoxide dehydrogenase small subunit